MKERRRVRNLVPAPAVRLMRRRVLSRPGVNSLLVWFSFTISCLFWSLHSCNSWFLLTFSSYSVNSWFLGNLIIPYFGLSITYISCFLCSTDLWLYQWMTKTCKRVNIRDQQIRKEMKILKTFFCTFVFLDVKNSHFHARLP